MEQNQNTNEHVQTGEAVPVEAQASTEPATPETSPPSSAEIKEEIPTLSTQSQTNPDSYRDEPQTQLMEVHKHPHHVMHSKKWHEYVLEFLMLFLAVALGFFAENLREHYSEKENAKRYLEAYKDELLQQKNVFEEYKKLYQNKIIVADTIKTIFFNGEENKKIDVLERLLVPSITLIEIPFNTSSYDQMVNAGALRYISSIELRDSMSAYKGQIETIKGYNTRLLQSIVNSTLDISKLIDFHDVVSTDTSQSYDRVHHIPQIKPFGVLTAGERNSIVFFFESYIVQSQSDLRRLRKLESANQKLFAMVNEQIEK